MFSIHSQDLSKQLGERFFGIRLSDVFSRSDMQAEVYSASTAPCLAVPLSSKFCELIPQSLYNLWVGIGEVLCLAWVILKVV